MRIPRGASHARSNRRSGSRLPFAVPVLVALCWTSACANVLGLDDEQSNVVAELCKCNEGDIVPQFNGNCEQELSDRLSSATEQTRERWLAFFVDNCAESGCATAFRCYQQDPTCSYTTCSEDRECCGFEDGNRCGNSGCVDADGNPL